MPSTAVRALTRPSRIIALLTTLAAIALFLAAPAVDGVSPAAIKGMALALFAVGLYATGAIAEHLASLSFFTIAMIFSVAPAGVVFSGFSSAAFWLVFSGLVIGVAVQKTGLGVRLATAITSRFSSSYALMVVGIVLVGVALAFVMPSTMGRVVLLMPIVIALCDHFGYSVGTSERNGLIMAMVCGTWMPSTAILPSNVPNMVLSGIAESMYSITFTYGDYMLTHLPVNGVLKAVSVIAVVLVLFPARRGTPQPVAETAEAQAMRPEARTLALILIATLGFWATDFIHHISPAWIGLAAAVICMLPGIGLVSGDDFKTKVNFPSTIYVAGILALGSILAHTGAGALAGGWLLTHLPLSPDAPFTSFLSIVGLGTLVNLASTAPSVPAVVGPFAGEIAKLSGLPLNTVLMSLVISYSTVILPYQVPPLIVGMHLGGVSMATGAKMSIVLALVALIVLVPLNYLWWLWLGLFG